MSLRVKLLAATALAGASAALCSGAMAYDGKWYLGFGAGGQRIPDDSLAYTTSDPNSGWIGDLRAGVDPESSWFRYELDLVWRENDIDQNTGPLDATGGDIQAESILLNVIYDIPIGRSFYPYVGIGGGWTHVKAKATGPNINFASSDGQLGGQFLAGMEWGITDNMLLNVEYRHFDMESAELQGTINTVPVRVEESFAGDALMAGLRWTFGGVQPAPPPAPVAAVPPPAPTVYKIFFPWNQYMLTAEAKQTVDEIAAQYKTQQITSVLISGNTDTSGSSDYNMGLGNKRAEAVKAQLIAQGIPESVISTETLGETNPAVSTGDNVKEPLNRRAEVTINLLSGPNS